MAGNNGNGTLTKAKQLSRPGNLMSTTTDVPILMAAASDLLARGGATDREQQALARFRNRDVIRPDDRNILGEMEDRNEFTAAERRVLSVAMRMTSFGPSTFGEPKPDPALELALAEAIAARDALQTVADLALDKVVVILAEMRKAERTGDRAGYAAAARREGPARDERRGAAEAVDRAQSRVATLLAERGARKRAWIATQP